MDLIPRLLAASPWTHVVVITAHGSIDAAVEAMKRGAADFLTKPFTPAQVGLVAERVARLRALEQRVAGLEGSPDRRGGGGGRRASRSRRAAPPMQRVLEHGPAGGRQRRLGADPRRERHRQGRAGPRDPRLERPGGQAVRDRLLPVAVGPTAGERTVRPRAAARSPGRCATNPGRIAAADGGTLFLDEIGDLPLELQPKLLRFLQDRQYERVGESVTRRADVRIVAATNLNLEEVVRAGRFREDLLYRLNVVQIELPAAAAAAGRRPAAGRPAAGATAARPSRSRASPTKRPASLRSYPWPGNVRELRNVIERAVILCHGEPDRRRARCPPPGAPARRRRNWATGSRWTRSRKSTSAGSWPPPSRLEEAARVLDIDLATLWRRRKKYGI